MQIRFNGMSLPFPGMVMGELREANPLLGDRVAMRQRLAEDGYLLVRNLISAEVVQGARRVILEEMQAAGLLQPGEPLNDGRVKPGGGSPFEERSLHHPDVLDVIDAPALRKFFSDLLEEPIRPLDLRIIRRVPAGPSTGIHYDNVYMGRGAAEVFTCWIPLGDIPVEQGPLAICAGSNSLAGFAKLRQTYGQHDVDRDRILGVQGAFPGWLSFDLAEITNQFGGCWQTTHFHAGDVIIFTMFTLHCGLDNTTDRFRISADVRYQAASAAADERWVGENPTGNHEAHLLHKGKIKPMGSFEDARRCWGV